MSKLNKKQHLLDEISRHERRHGSVILSVESLSLRELSNNELLKVLESLDWGSKSGLLLVGRKQQEVNWELSKS